MNKMNSRLKVWLIAALCLALIAFSIPFATTRFSAEDENGVIIVLDPGHGGPDFGACNTSADLYESEINLKIARACKAELERYDGVTVYMTHNGLDPNGSKMTLNERVRFANSVDADILISLHTNDAQSSTACGSEVYVSHSTYKPEYNEQSTQLAICFLKQFREMGFEIRGVKTRLSNGSRQYYHSDGTQETGDYYAVIGDTIKYYAIPGILVEHGFIKGDSDMFDSDEELVKLGIADATAIAEYYQLTLKSDAGSSPTVFDIISIELTEEERAQSTETEAYILSLPLEITIDDEYDVRRARDMYEQLNDRQKAAFNDDIANSLYVSVLELEYLLHPVRAEISDDENVFINRFNSTISAFEDQPQITVGDITQQLYIAFDMNALLKNARIDAEGQLLLEYGDGFSDELLNERAQQIVDEYLLNTEFVLAMFDRNGEILADDEIIGSGCVLKVLAGGEAIDELTVVRTGDISGDGIVDSLDNLLLSRHLNGIELLSGSDLLAADINGDNTVNSDDALALSENIVS